MSDTETHENEAAETAAAPIPAVFVVPSGGLLFISPEGRVLLRLCEKPSGAALALYNAAGQCVAYVATTDDGGGEVAVMHDGDTQANLVSNPGGAGWIAVNHPDGPPATALLVGPESGFVARFDPEGNVITDAADPLALDPALLPWPPGGHTLN